MNGKSCSPTNPKGVRREVTDHYGQRQTRLPKSARRKTGLEFYNQITPGSKAAEILLRWELS